jgi:hypothetical protein
MNSLDLRDTSVTLGTTNDEAARRLKLTSLVYEQSTSKTHVVDGAVVKERSVDDLLDDLLLELAAELLSRDLLGVLGRDNNGVNAERDHGSRRVLLVLDGDLSLGVGAEPAESAVTASSGHGVVELVGEHDSKGHVLGGLVGSVTEHDTLVTGTVVLKVSVVETLSNVGRLLLNGNQDVAGLVVETLVRVVVTNLLDSGADNVLVVDVGLGGDLTEDHDHTGLGSGLDSNLGVGVLSQAGVKDSIRDLVTDLVGVSLSDGFGLQNVSSHMRWMHRDIQ